VVFIILFVVDIVLGLIFSPVPRVLGRGLSTVVSGTVVASFLALIVTLIYYRLLETPATGYAPPSGPTGGYQPPPGGVPPAGGPPG